MSFLLVLGVLFIGVGVVLTFDIAGLGRSVIKNLTSKPLGTLAPGFAATRQGMETYGLVLATCGLMLISVPMASIQPVAGLVGLVGGFIAFLLVSVLAIVGEVRTYRALKR
jgi:hypothetical protein